MRKRRSNLGPLHRAILWGGAAVLVAGTGVVGAATASTGGHRWFTPVSTGGSFLPTSGPQRTLIIGPDHHVYAPPTQVPPHPDPAFLQQVPGGKCVADNPYEKGYINAQRYGGACKRITFAFGPI
ncbi:MAG: hypothetical protein QOF18_1911, partial [Frankiaceae bacterium]|nr:hypothetical protein [Frankiaceae bacterium]